MTREGHPRLCQPNNDTVAIPIYRLLICIALLREALEGPSTLMIRCWLLG